MEKDITLPNPTPLPSNQQITYPLDPVSQNILKEFVRGIQIQAFPIGSIFISVVATDPSTLLGYGTWTAFGTGRTLVGIDTGQTEFDVVEETGGSKTHTLTIAEMPAHDHGSNLFNSNGGASNPGAGGGYGTSNTGSTGGGGSHNNLQPYIVTYMWKRTA